MNSKKNVLIGCFSSKNWYSFAPLLGVLEEFDELKDFEFRILKNRSNYILKNTLNKFKMVILTYSFYTHETPKIAAEIKRIKKRFSNHQLIFIAGGPHASGNPRQTLHLGFDLVVKGEGEKILPLLLSRIQKEEAYSNIKGVCFWKNNQVVLSEPEQRIDLDEYPTFSREYKLYPPIEITRGCPFGCKYCQVTYLFGNKMRHRSHDIILKIVKEYQKIFAGRRSTDIRFISPNSLAYGSKDGKTPNPPKIHKLLKSIAELGNTRIFFATFPSETRPEFITPTILKEISPFITNDHIAFGAQSGSDRILKMIGRQHTVEDIRNAAETILDANLIPIVDFILGLPGEEIEDQYQTLELIRELIRQKGEIRIHYFMPLAGTPFENATPVALEPKLLSELGRYAKKGYLKGNLDSQIKHSAQILKFLHSLEET